MKRAIILFLSALFAACAAPTPAPTSIPTATLTPTTNATTVPTASATPPPTFTPTPAFPPEFLSLGLDPAEYTMANSVITCDADGAKLMEQVNGEWQHVVDIAPEVVTAVETQLPGYKIGAGDMLLDLNGKIVTGMRVFQTSKGLIVLQRPAELNGQPYTETVPLHRVSVTEDGKLDIQGLRWNPETNQMEQEYVLYPVPNSHDVEETDIPLVSMSYAMTALEQATQEYINADPDHILQDGVMNAGIKDILPHAEGSYWIVGDMRLIAKFMGTNHEFFRSNYIMKWDETMGEFMEVPTVRFIVTTFGSEPKTQYSFLSFKKLSGEIVRIYIDRNDLTDHSDERNRGVFGDLY